MRLCFLCFFVAKMLAFAFLMKHMMTAELIDSLFNAELPEASHWETQYPPRELRADAIVTRFAPSPTGFLHTGGVYTAMLAKKSRSPLWGRVFCKNRRH